MGSRHSEQGPNMGMELSPSSIPPTYIYHSGGFYPAVTGCGRHRRDYIPSLPRSSLLGSEEEFDKETGHLRPVNSQPFDFMPNLSDDDTARCQIDAPNRGIRGVDRLKGCLLAHPHSSLLQEIPRFCHRGQEVQVSSPTIRPQHCPQNLHEDLQTNPQGAEIQRGDGISIHRRLVDMGQLVRRVPEGNPNYQTSPGKKGLHNKLFQISSNSVPVSGLARRYLEHEDRPIIPSSGEGYLSDSGSILIFEVFLNNTKTDREVHLSLIHI